MCVFRIWKPIAQERTSALSTPDIQQSELPPRTPFRSYMSHSARRPVLHSHRARAPSSPVSLACFQIRELKALASTNLDNDCARRHAISGALLSITGYIGMAEPHVYVSFLSVRVPKP